MSETKFTPGPWLADSYHSEILTSARNESRYVALSHGQWDEFSDEQTANAHLIAAAPELYEACKELSEFAARQGWLHVAINKANAALSKARGEINTKKEPHA